MTTMSTPVSAGPASVPARRTARVAWIWVLLLVLGLGAGFLVGRVTKADTVLPADLASPAVTKLLADYEAAVNSGDVTKIESFFATDATFTDTTRTDGYVMEGRARIAQAIASWHPLGFRWGPGGTAIVNGEFVAQSGNANPIDAMAVFQIKNGRFQHVWVVRP